MFNNSTKKVLFLSLIFALGGCSVLPMSQSESIAAKEKLYQSTNNYSGLISLYREQLKTEENNAVRYKLALAYYQKGDSQSSLDYLQPLLDEKNIYFTSATVLQIRNLIQLKKYHEAIDLSTMLINKHPHISEAYNLRGIANAQLGNYKSAEQDIHAARKHFINDVIAINNLAMLKIINGEYRGAVNLLLPQYLNGVKEQRLVHNLVFALVKSGDTDYALDIIKKENLNTSPKDLVNALKNTEKVGNTGTPVRPRR
ncbi:tetratricopeptide repeat protein [Bisgaard Taxon 10/6]|uniref:Tetratricopeptide repeat protein n=1 Tax=Exercitatus varius TaxID=67857 RepID=A0ABT6ETE3_9PAST|nr:tetratricopeptide repeat protein [Exercitatus varius]MDG2915284.1 tetratricopeptide repeat protein [Exercitatus varius]MDG2940408.1 tetratricopeptide repeat protein [Exercitatus varius]MDG2942721.1 tetratricopeptide repeat protein [Exercitatus varius]MDG2943687.1 tetratricopeptide repeat protein [Exercitatus varius]MDG2946828.1 tetratricopeptide repeat protein [Exercitatus varius]